MAGLMPWDLYSTVTGAVSARLMPASDLNAALNRGPCEIWVSMRGSCLAFVDKQGTKVQVLQTGSDDWVELSCACVTGREPQGENGSTVLRWAWMQPSDCGSSLFGLLEMADEPQSFAVWFCSTLREAQPAWSRVLAVPRACAPVCSTWFKESNAGEFSLAVSYLECTREGLDSLHIQMFTRGDSLAVPGNELDQESFVLQDSAARLEDSATRAQSLARASVRHSVHWDPSGRQFAIIVAREETSEGWLLFISKSLVCTKKLHFPNTQGGVNVPVSCTWIDSDLLATLSATGELSVYRSSTGACEVLHWHSVASGLRHRNTPSDILSRKHRLPYSLWGKNFAKAGPLSLTSVHGEGFIHLLISDVNSIADVSVFLPPTEELQDFTVRANSVLDKEERSPAGLESVERFGRECLSLLRLAVHNECVHPQVVDLVRILQRSFISAGRTSKAVAFTGKCHSIVETAGVQATARTSASLSLCAELWQSLAAISCLEEPADGYETTVEIAMDYVRELSRASTSTPGQGGEVEEAHSDDLPSHALDDIERGNVHFSAGDQNAASSCFTAAREAGVVLPLISLCIHDYDFHGAMRIMRETFEASARSGNERQTGLDLSAQIREASWWFGILLDGMSSAGGTSCVGFPYPSSWFILESGKRRLNPQPVCFRLDARRVKQDLAGQEGLSLDLASGAWFQMFGSVLPSSPDRLKEAAAIWERHGEWRLSAFFSAEAARHAANGTRGILEDYALNLFSTTMSKILQKDVCLRNTLELYRCIHLAKYLDVPNLYYVLLNGALGCLTSAQTDRVTRIDLGTALQLGATASWSYQDAQILAAEIILVLPHFDQIIGVPGFSESAFAHVRGEAAELPILGFSISGAVEKTLKTTVQILWTIESWKQIWSDYAELQNFIASDGDPSEAEGFVFGLLLASAKILQCDRFHQATQLHSSILDMWIDLPESCLFRSIPEILLHFIPGKKAAGGSVKKWRHLKSKCEGSLAHNSEDRETICAIESFISDQFNSTCMTFFKSLEKAKEGLGSSSEHSGSDEFEKSCLETALEIVASTRAGDLDLHLDDFEKCVRNPFRGQDGSSDDPAAVIMEIFCPGGASSSDGSSYLDSTFSESSMYEERSSEVNQAIDEMLSSVIGGIGSDESSCLVEEVSNTAAADESLTKYDQQLSDADLEMNPEPGMEPEQDEDPELEIDNEPEADLGRRPGPYEDPAPKTDLSCPMKTCSVAESSAELVNVLAATEEVVSEIVSQIEDEVLNCQGETGEEPGICDEGGPADCLRELPSGGSMRVEDAEVRQGVESEGDLEIACFSSLGSSPASSFSDVPRASKSPSQTTSTSGGAESDSASLPESESESESEHTPSNGETSEESSQAPRNQRNISQDPPKLLTPVTQIGIALTRPVSGGEFSGGAGVTSALSGSDSEGKSAEMEPAVVQDSVEAQTSVGVTLPVRNLSHDKAELLSPLTQMFVPQATPPAAIASAGTPALPSPPREELANPRVAELVGALEEALAAQSTDLESGSESGREQDSSELASDVRSAKSGSSAISTTYDPSYSHASESSGSYVKSPAQRLFRDRLDHLHSLVEGFTSSSDLAKGDEKAMALQWAKARKTLEEMQEITDKKIEESTVQLEALEPLDLPEVYTSGRQVPRSRRRLSPKTLKKVKPRYITPWEEDMLTLQGKNGTEASLVATNTDYLRNRKLKRYHPPGRGLVQASGHTSSSAHKSMRSPQPETVASPSVQGHSEYSRSASAFSFGVKGSPTEAEGGNVNSPTPSLTLKSQIDIPAAVPSADRGVLNEIYQEINSLKSQVQGSFPLMSKLSDYLESREAKGREDNQEEVKEAAEYKTSVSPKPRLPSRFQDVATSPKPPSASDQSERVSSFATPPSSPSPKSGNASTSRSGYNGDRVKAMMARLKREKFTPRRGIFAPDADIKPLPAGLRADDTTEVEEEREETQRAIETLQEPFEKLLGQIEYQHSLSAQRQPLNFDDQITDEDIERVLAEVSTIILEEAPSPKVRLPKGSQQPRYKEIQEEREVAKNTEATSPSTSSSSVVIHAYVDDLATDVADAGTHVAPEQHDQGRNDSPVEPPPPPPAEEGEATDAELLTDPVGQPHDQALHKSSKAVLLSNAAGGEWPQGDPGPTWFKDPFSMATRAVKVDPGSAQKAFRIASCGRNFVYRNDVTSIYALLLDKITLQQLSYIDLVWDIYVLTSILPSDEQISIDLFLHVTQDAHSARSAESSPNHPFMRAALERASDLLSHRSSVSKLVKELGGNPKAASLKMCMEALLRLAGTTLSPREACYVLARLHRAGGWDTEATFDLSDFSAVLQPRQEGDPSARMRDADAECKEEMHREASALAIQGAFRSWLKDSRHTKPRSRDDNICEPEVAGGSDDPPVRDSEVEPTDAEREGKQRDEDKKIESRGTSVPPEEIFLPQPHQPRKANADADVAEETEGRQGGRSPPQPGISSPAPEDLGGLEDRWSSASYLERYVEVEAEKKAADAKKSRRSQRSRDNHAASVRLSAAQRAARAAEARVLASQKKLQEAKRKEMTLLAKDVAKALSEVDQIAKDMETEAAETNKMMQAYEEERKQRNQDYLGILSKQIKALGGRIEEEDGRGGAVYV